MVELLDEGTAVFSSDGEKVGDLHRVVVNRKSLRATHIVVDIGALRAGREVLRHGLAGEYDRVVAIEDVASAGADDVRLRLSEAEFMQQPRYTDEEFEEPYDLTPGQFDVTDLARFEQEIASRLPTGVPQMWLMDRLHRTRDERDVLEGTPVWRQEPHEKIGEVDKLLLNPQSERVQAFVIKRGFVFQHEVVLPVRYLTELLDDIVRVDLTDAELEQLRRYEEAPRP